MFIDTVLTGERHLGANIRHLRRSTGRGASFSPEKLLFWLMCRIIFNLHVPSINCTLVIPFLYIIFISECIIGFYVFLVLPATTVSTTALLFLPHSYIGLDGFIFYLIFFFFLRGRIFLFRCFEIF